MKTFKLMNNREISKLLREIAAAYEVKKEDRFKITAYEDAADSIERNSSETRGMWEKGKLEDIPGVGKSIAGHLDELFQTGKVKHFSQIRKALPEGMFPLLQVNGIGPSTAYRLAKRLKILSEKNAIKNLKKAILNNEVAGIEGFGQDSQKKLLGAIEELARRKNRVILPVAEELANKVIEYMKKIRSIERIEVLGSLRRRSATVGDVDIAVATNEPEAVLNHFVEFEEWKKVLAKGENTSRAIHRSGRQVDIKTEPPEQFGSLLQHYTGSKNHNVQLRELALKQGLSLSEHGVKKVQKSKIKNQNLNSKIKTFGSEEEFYHYLGLEWIPPELREGNGEIEASSRAELPELVKMNDIKGDLHVHSNIDVEPSHDLGLSSLAELVEKAISLKYGYLAISDHNPSSSRHNQQQIIDLIKRRNELIDKYNSSRGNNMKIRLFKSMEVDILPTGKLAVPDSGLELLDFVIVSIHSSFSGSAKSQTDRVIEALNHPKARILGHPTGRILQSREGVNFEWERLFEFCQKKKIWLEVNANPNRLDLPDDMIRLAIERDLTLAIGTDSHQVDQMDLMRFGVDQLRRGWAGKSNVVNSLGYNKVSKLLESW